MTYHSRVTVDLDGHVSHFRIRALRIFHFFERHADETEVRISSGGSGLHIIGWYGAPVSDGDKLDIRRHLGDDPSRIEMDEIRNEWGHTTGVCWDSKYVGTESEQEADTDFETVEDALTHIDCCMSFAERARRLVQPP